MNKSKICGIATKFTTLKSFMFGTLSYCAKNGYDSYAISNQQDLEYKIPDDVKFIPVAMGWGNVTPWEVLKSTYRLWKIMRRERFDIVQYATSNAGLYACFAAWLARIPVRIYCQWGISYTDYTGIKFWFYKAMEKATCFLSTSVQPDSKANLKFAISEGLYKPEKGSVLFNGSACGADLQRYDISKKEDWREEIVSSYQIGNYKRVLGFVGRVVPEKGINELLEAFMQIGDKDCLLMIVGSLNQVSRLNQDIYKRAEKENNILFTGLVPNAAKFFAAFNFMMLPSYREGFGMTVLEAAAMGVPSIISNIKGPTDLIRNGYNGIVCDVKSTESLKIAIENALQMSDYEYRILCKNAYQEVLEKFDGDKFKKAFLDNRNLLLMKK